MDYIDDNSSDDEPTETEPTEGKDRYELILTKTNRFFIVDLKKIKEAIKPTNE